ncbi:MAG: cell division protein FtsA [Deltaproteobacteria bacterium]|nr:cell division protein FtsA [Deltaproteobacteria bacterium]
MAKREGIVVGLDIGTTKICCIVGEATENGLDVIGIGTAPSKGLKKGVVINIEATVSAIRRAVEEAELMAGVDIGQVYAGISGGHIKGFNSHGTVAVKDGEVTESDIARVIESAKAVAIPLDREIIHVLPQEFVVDDQDGIKEPLGMSGVRLEARVHIVSGAVTSAQNIIKCANKTGLNVSDIVLQQLASSHAVLNEDEKDLGVGLVDIGGGTTDLAIWSGGSIVHTSVLPIGGNHVTNDIAVGLRTPTDEAENIKQKHGVALASMVHKDDAIEVASVGGRKNRQLSKQILAEIIEPRIEEIFTLVKKEIHKTGHEELLASGVVVTGGSAIMPGVLELAEDVLGLPIRLGQPQGVGGLADVVRSPMYATAVGLVLFGARNIDASNLRMPGENVYSKVRTRMREWFSDMF